MNASSAVIGNLWLILDAAVESASFLKDEESLEPSINLFLFYGALVELSAPGIDPALVGEAIEDTPNVVGFVLFLTEFKWSAKFG